MLGLAGVERASSRTRAHELDTSSPHSSCGIVLVREVTALPLRNWQPVSISRRACHIDPLTEGAARPVCRAAPSLRSRGVAPLVPDSGSPARTAIVRCPYRTIAAGIAWFRCTHRNGHRVHDSSWTINRPLRSLADEAPERSGAGRCAIWQPASALGRCGLSPGRGEIVTIARL